MRQLSFILAICIGAFFVSITCFAAEAENSATTPSSADEMGHMVTMSDFGAEDLGYLVIPQTPPVGGVVVVHDKWGLDKSTKQIADQFARAGYLTLAVDLCNGRTAADSDAAESLAQGMRLDSAMKIVRAGVRLLRESPKLKVSRVALVGHGIGGEACWRALTEVKGIDAVATIEPYFNFDPKRIAKLRVPICNVYPDAYPQPSATLAAWQKLAGSKGSLIEQHIVGQRVDFSDPNSPFYDPTKAKQAWDVTGMFIQKALAKPASAPGIVDKIKSFF